MKYLFRIITIRQRLWFIVAFSVLSTLGVAYQGLVVLKENLTNDRRDKVQQLVEVVYGVIEHYAGLAEEDSSPMKGPGRRP